VILMMCSSRDGDGRERDGSVRCMKREGAESSSRESYIPFRPLKKASTTVRSRSTGRYMRFNKAVELICVLDRPAARARRIVKD
jgi:hypothetical protein